MAIVLIAAWMGFLALLVKLRILKGWTMWMKWSPLAIWVGIMLVVFIPMNFGAPSGPAIVLKNSVAVSPAVSGIVTEVPVSSDAQLGKGEVLFLIDPVPYEAVVTDFEAQVDFTRRRLEQTKKLVAQKAGKLFDQQQYEAQLSQLEARLEGARWNLEQTAVRAPSDGYVPAIVLQPGTQVSPAVPVMAFISTSDTSLAVQIEQVNLRNIESGQQAEVVLKLYPGKVFSATVEKIVRGTPAGQVAPSGFSLRTDAIVVDPFWVELVLEDKSLDLPPGAVGTAGIFTKAHTTSHVFRKIILRMDTWLNYIKPSF